MKINWKKMGKVSLLIIIVLFLASAGALKLIRKYGNTGGWSDNLSVEEKERLRKERDEYIESLGDKGERIVP